MGLMKEMIIERQQEEADKKLADKLDITYDELLELDYEIDTHESKDGLIYNYIIEFNENSPVEILSKIKGLEDGKRIRLQPEELYDYEDEYYDDQYNAILENTRFYDTFVNELKKLKKLNDVKIEDENLSKILKRQIYIGVIGTLETFLSDTFINLTVNNDEYFKNFIETHPHFKQMKFELREIFVQNEMLKETAKRVMLDTIYHDLPKINKMYEATFKINFPELGSVIKFITTRHDLVHRNGKTKDGEEVTINKEEVSNVLEKVSDFASKIANELNLKELEVEW